MSMPQQRPGRSKQDYGTPNAFTTAVERRFQMRLHFDLAASDKNAIVLAPNYFTQQDDALVQNWHKAVGADHWAWLNPPYANIGPWAAKCGREGLHIHIAMLVPASIGSNWFRDYVHEKALVLALSPRLTFRGCTTPYPKDTILCVYGPTIASGFDVWNWRK